MHCIAYVRAWRIGLGRYLDSLVRREALLQNGCVLSCMGAEADSFLAAPGCLLEKLLELHSEGGSAGRSRDFGVAFTADPAATEV
jgi:hypothetical protein